MASTAYHRSHIRADDENEESNLYIRFPKIWEDFVEVTWGRQIFDGYKPIKYQLLAEGESYRVERYFGATENTFRLQGLSPNMTLKVQVRALVDSPKGVSSNANVGSSRPLTFSASTGDEQVPDETSLWMAWSTAIVTTLPSVGVEVATVSSNFIHGRFLFGSVAEKDRQYAAPTFDKSTPSHNYLTVKEIQFKMRDKGPFRSFEVCEKVFPADQHEFTINELSANLVLEVEARAISSFGDVGLWCSPVRFLTLPAVEVSVVEIGEAYAITKWEREVDDKNPFAEDAGIAEMVMIVDILPSQRELDVDSQAKKQQVLAQSFSNETRMFRLRDLLPGRNYVIRSRYRNVLGDWAQWTLAPFTTLFPVESPDVQLVGHNFIQVSWRRGFEGSRQPTAEDDSRSVQQWEVRCQVGKAATTMTLPKKEMETKMVNLHSGVDYTIDVRARNEAGEWGLWSTPLVATTLHRLVPRVEAAGDTWVEASWLRRDKVYQDNITRYHVQLSAVGSTFRTAKYFPPDVTSFTFKDLRPNTKFVLVLQAFSEDHWGPWSDPVEVSTCAPAAPLLVRRGEDFVQIRWNSDYYNRSNIDVIDRRYQLRIMRPKIPTAEEEQVIAERGGGVMQLSAAAPTEDVIEETSQSTFRINHLPSFSRVNVQIRMYDFHRQAWGEWGEERSFRTLPSVIVATHIGENVAEISWSRNPRIMCGISDEELEAGVEDSLAPNGVKKFILKVNEITGEGTGGHKEVGKYHFDEGQATLFSITGLHPDSIYTVQLSYFDSSAAWSTPSAPLKFRTAPPLQIYVMDISEGHTTLRWGRWVRGENEIAVQENNFRIILEDLSMPSTVPLQQAVQGATQYTVTDLKPSTLYRVSISAAMHIHSQYGAWSEPVYICTSSSMEVKLNLVGEDYAVLSWSRSIATVAALPNARFVTVTYDDGKSNRKRVAPRRNNDTDGNVIYIGDATVLEHHVQLQKLIPSAAGEDDTALGGRPTAELVFDAKVHASQHSLRVPNLEPDTQYKAYVCVSSHSHQWGTWSPPLTFHTAMPTAVYIAAMAPEAITIKWGKLEGSDEAHSNVWRYQLRVDGVEENYHTQVELERDVTEYTLKGLSMNACYAVSVRTHLDTEHDWGQWCKPMYVVIRRVPVDVVESAQNWTHIAWKSGFKHDAAPKAQFLSLLSSSAATVTCLEPHIDRYIFRNLDPSTMYAAHLIAVEQSSQPVKVIPAAPPIAGARGVQAKKIIGDSKHPPSFSIPIVAADFSQFLEEGFAFRTQRVLQLRAESVGQNHIMLQWSNRDSSSSNSTALVAPAEGVDPTAPEDDTAGQVITSDDTFEVETVDGDSRKITKARGTSILIRSLKPSSTVRCAVRWVASKSDTPSDWCKPITVTMLPIVEPTLGNANTTAGAAPGIGEDYLIVHWKRSLRNSNFLNRMDLAFEAKLRQLVGEGKSEEIIVSTREAGYHFTNLKADTPYELTVRTVIPVSYHGVLEHVKGEWSAPLVCMTLSPISAVAIDVTETAATICWKRRNTDQSVDGNSSDVDEREGGGTKNHDHRGEQGARASGTGAAAGAVGEGITSFRVRVVKLNPDGSAPLPSSSAHNDSNAGVIYDEQFTDTSDEFMSRLTRIGGLQPGANYSATVRASTGLIWGAWSDPFCFATNVLCEIDLKLVADTFVAMEWNRPEYIGGGETAQLTAWELAFETVGVDKDDTATNIATKANDNSRANSAGDPTDADDAQIKGDRNQTSATPSSADYIVHVSPNNTRATIGGLSPNAAYAVRVRPVYMNGRERGSWSSTRHFLTLASLIVDAGRIGETFVLIQWRRGQHTPIETRVRAKQKLAVDDLTNRLANLRRQLETVRLSSAKSRSSKKGDYGANEDDDEIRTDDGGESSFDEEDDEDASPLDINALAGGDFGGPDSPQQSSSSSSKKEKKRRRQQKGRRDGVDSDDAFEGEDAEEDDGGDAITMDGLFGGQLSSANKKQRAAAGVLGSASASEAYLIQQIATMEKRVERARIVAAMKVEEISKACFLPNGVEVQYELWLRQSKDNVLDGVSGYVFRKRLDASHLSFRVENLTPQTHYEVSVRALYTDRSVDLTGYATYGLDEDALPSSTGASPLGPSSRGGGGIVFAPAGSVVGITTARGGASTSAGTGNEEGEAFSPASTLNGSTNALLTHTQNSNTINGGAYMYNPSRMQNRRDSEGGLEEGEVRNVPWTVWSRPASFVTLKPIVTKVRGVGSTCLVLEWDTGRIGGGVSVAAGGSGVNATRSLSIANSESLLGASTTPSTGGIDTIPAANTNALVGSLSAEEVDERSKTAITKFQIHIADEHEQPKDTITLTDPRAREHVISNLRPNTAYIVAVRVCYDEDKWGVWSRPTWFMTMPPLMAKLQSTAERQVELLVWRDHEGVPPNQETVVWRPPVTEHQLSINANPCTQAFTLERGTSTMLTLDALAVDTQYRIAVQDKVLDHWQSFQEVLVCETIPHPPMRPLLKERKGQSVVVAWEHERSLPEHHQYVYMVEMAVQQPDASTTAAKGSSSCKRSLVASKRSEIKGAVGRSAGQFDLLGFTEAAEYRLELDVPINHCFFRVQCCKTNQTVDGEDAPVARLDPYDPQSILMEHPGRYTWSRPSPIGHFKTPSVPDHPSGLHITNLTHNSATVHWKKPANWREHTGLVYRVHLNNSYQDRFTFLAQTENTYLHLTDLVTNCHYRVAVTAESSMGISINNNTLHFSTKVVPVVGGGGAGAAAALLGTRTGDPPKLRAANKAANSTVPPRRALTAPEDVVMSARHRARNAAQAFAPLLDDTASSVFTAARVISGQAVGGGGGLMSGGSDEESGRNVVRNTRTPEPRILSAVAGIPRSMTPPANGGRY